MTLLFRSKSYGPGSYVHLHSISEKEDEEDDKEAYNEGIDFETYKPISTSFRSPRFKEREGGRGGGGGAGWRRVGGRWRRRQATEQAQFPIVEIILAALRKSLVTCSVESDDVASSMDIGWPTDVKHVSHVTFDRFNGFLGLPVELQPEVPRRVPSASIRVFGVSPQSMQCSIDERGNSVPTILLLMQKRLYAEGGLLAEGIFRLTAENSQEEFLRSQLNNGLVPQGIDTHCLAGLIKAWFRELPKGVLDSLTPEQVMNCNTEYQCAQLVKLLSPIEAALLDWAINLMADVVHNEHYNKMNARNIAVVFAPNMTQMADPLTALIHAVQVMNFLKTLIEKTLREREETAAITHDQPTTSSGDTSHEMLTDGGPFEERKGKNLLGTFILDRTESRSKTRQRNTRERSDEDGKPCTPVSRGSSPIHLRGKETSEMKHDGGGSSADGCESSEGEGLLERLSFRKGVKKLCRHPVFQLSKPVKKNGDPAVVST